MRCNPSTSFLPIVYHVVFLNKAECIIDDGLSINRDILSQSTECSGSEASGNHAIRHLAPKALWPSDAQQLNPTQADMKWHFFEQFHCRSGVRTFSGRPGRPAPTASYGRLSYRTPCALPRRTPSASPPGTSGSTRTARRRTSRRRPRASPFRGRTRP